MTRVSLQTIIVTLTLLLITQALIGQRGNKAAKLPSIKYSKIKKAKIKTKLSSFKAFICDIDSSNIYYYLDKKETKKLIETKCSGCATYPIENVKSILFSKASPLDQGANLIAGIVSTLYVGSLLNSNRSEYSGYAIFIGVPALATLTVSSIGNISSLEPRKISKEELTNQSFEDSWEFMAYKSYQKIKTNFLKAFVAQNTLLNHYPDKSKHPYLFTLEDGSQFTGYVVKVVNNKIHLTKNLAILEELRKSQSDTELKIDFSKVELIAIK